MRRDTADMSINSVIKLFFFNLISRNLRERVDHGCHRGFVPGAHIVKVQHALHGTCLHAPDNGLGLFPE